MKTIYRVWASLLAMVLQVTLWVLPKDHYQRPEIESILTEYRLKIG